MRAPIAATVVILAIASAAAQSSRQIINVGGNPTLPFSPAVQSCRRLGLPAGHLYRRRGTG